MGWEGLTMLNFSAVVPPRIAWKPQAPHATEALNMDPIIGGLRLSFFGPTRRQKSKNLMAKISGPTRNGMTSQHQLGEDKVKGGHNGKTSPCNDPTKCFLMVRLLREYTTQVYSRTYSKWRLELSLFLT